MSVNCLMTMIREEVKKTELKSNEWESANRNHLYFVGKEGLCLYLYPNPLGCVHANSHFAHFVTIFSLI